MIRAGSLKHSVKFLQRVKQASTHGKKTTYEQAFCVKARIEKLITDSDEENASKNTGTLKLTVRYKRDITDDMRIEFRGVVYTITLLDNVLFANKELYIEAQITK